MDEPKAPRFSCVNVTCGYGKRRVLHNVSVSVARGQVVAIIGHNGAGKSTLLKASFGILPMWEGAVFISGTRVSKPEPAGLIHRGVAYVPQGNRAFTRLSVRDNLELACYGLGRRERERRLEEVLARFSILVSHLEDRAEVLSGGEKQVLALASAFMLMPTTVLVDEPSLGLAPTAAADALQQLKQICSASGASVIVVEQKVREVLKIADRVIVLRQGTISYEGTSADLAKEGKLQEVFL